MATREQVDELLAKMAEERAALEQISRQLKTR